MKINLKNKFIGIGPFLKEVKLELKKVNWPSRKETLKYTLVVIGFSAIVALFLGGLDFVFAFLLDKFIVH